MRGLLLATVFVFTGVSCGRSSSHSDSDEIDLRAAEAPLSAPVATSDGPASETVVVYKSPTCGCCTKWADHMRTAGFSVDEKLVEDVDSVKDDLGVPAGLRSCHTGVVGGYAIEGHVPSEQVKRLLAERPQVAGIAVPGMPMGSPGMESPTPEAYTVVSFDKDGRTATFAEIPAASATH